MNQLANFVGCLVLATSVGVLYNWHHSVGIAAVVYVLAMSNRGK